MYRIGYWNNCHIKRNIYPCHHRSYRNIEFSLPHLSISPFDDDIVRRHRLQVGAIKGSMCSS